MSPSAHVFDVTIANFEQDVLLASSKLPILVDFWATWCEPCKTLVPVLERIAEDMGGSFLLAKVDIDQNPEIAQAFRIQSVPTVILIVDGKPVDAFAGAKSDKEIREFLAPHLAGGTPTSPLEEAKELATAGQVEAAKTLVEDWLAENEDDGEARAVLAGWLLDEGDAESAAAHYDQLLPVARELPAGQSVAARLALMEGAGDVGELQASVESNPKDVGKRIELGNALVAAGRTEEGLEELLEAAMRDMQFEDGAPRKALIEVFQALGPADALTLEFQQRLSVLLCS